MLETKHIIHECRKGGLTELWLAQTHFSLIWNVDKASFTLYLSLSIDLFVDIRSVKLKSYSLEDSRIIKAEISSLIDGRER